jgi:hypothetical protein
MRGHYIASSAIAIRYGRLLQLPLASLAERYKGQSCGDSWISRHRFRGLLGLSASFIVRSAPGAWSVRNPEASLG